MISVLLKGKKAIIQVLIILFLSSVAFLNISRIRNSIFERKKSTVEVEPKSETFQLAQCNCSRTLFDIEQNRNNSVQFSETTCSWDAFRRGSNQKVAGFSFYGNTSSSAHKSKKYFEGIKENLRLVRSLYGDDWSMRLYYDLAQSDELMGRLCELACNNNHLDLCNVRQLPGNPVRDASDIFPMNWRFLPPLDPQVSVFLCRDLDSRISAREVAAVTEWLQS